MAEEQLIYIVDNYEFRWLSLLDGSNGFNDSFSLPFAEDISVIRISEDGSIYLGSTSDDRLLKYNSSGTQQWEVSFSYRVRDIFIDEENDVIYCTATNGTNSDVKKIDFDGNVLQEESLSSRKFKGVYHYNGKVFLYYDGSNSYFHIRDSSDLSFINSFSISEQGSDVLSFQPDGKGDFYFGSTEGIVKVDEDLTVLDHFAFATPETDIFIFLNDIVVDRRNEYIYAYARRYDDTVGESTYRLKKFDFSGNEIWELNSDNVSEIDGGSQGSLDVDDEGCAILGTGSASSGTDDTIVRISPFGSVLWSTTNYSWGDTSYPFVLIHPSNNVSILRSDYVPDIFITDTNEDLYTIVNDNNSYGGINQTLTNSDSVFSLKRDELGYFYIGTDNGLVKKYDSNGSLIWTYDFQSTSAKIFTLDLDSFHNVYAVGGEDQTIRKIDSQGNHLWTNSLPANVTFVSVGSDDRALVSTNDGVIRKFYQNGDELWANNSSASSNPVQQVLVDREDNSVYFVSFKNPGLDIGKLDSDGSELWVNTDDPATQNFFNIEIHPYNNLLYFAHYIYYLDGENNVVELWNVSCIDKHGTLINSEDLGNIIEPLRVKIGKQGYLYTTGVRTSTGNQGIEVFKPYFDPLWGEDVSNSSTLFVLGEPPPPSFLDLDGLTNNHQELSAGVTNIAPQFNIDTALTNPHQTLSSSITHTIDRWLDFAVDNPLQTITVDIQNDSPEYALYDADLINPHQTLTSSMSFYPLREMNIDITNAHQTFSSTWTVINPRDINIAVENSHHVLSATVTMDPPVFSLDTAVTNPFQTFSSTMSWGAERHLDIAIINQQQIAAQITVPQTISIELVNQQIFSVEITNIVPQFNLSTSITNHYQQFEAEVTYDPYDVNADIGPLTNPMQTLSLGLFFGIYPRTIEEIDLDNPHQVLTADFNEFHHSTITSEIILPQVELDFQIAWYDANIPLTRYVQQPSLDERIELFEIDATVIGGQIYRFTASSNYPIFFQGKEFTPLPVETEGFEWNGQGALPTPKMRFSAVSTVIRGLVIEHNDFLGCKVKRIRTFRRFLDGQVSEDPDAHFPIDVYNVNRKTNQNKVFVEFELAAAMDQEGRKLPGRVVIRDVCTHKYRYYDPDTGDFDYSQATCPYTGNDYFDRADKPTTKDKDVCSRRLSGCKARFGNGNLPTRQFPGAAKVRV